MIALLLAILCADPSCLHDCLFYQTLGKVTEVYKYDTRTGSSSLFMTGYRLGDVSTDGKTVALVKDQDEMHHSDLYLMDYDKSNLRKITTESFIFRACFSPDGKYIAYIADNDGTWASGEENADIYMMELENNATSRLTDDSRYKSGLVFSPKGDFAYYTQKGLRKIYVKNRSKSKIEVNNFAVNDISINGNQIAFGGREHGLVDGHGKLDEIYIMSELELKPKRLTFSPPWSGGVPCGFSWEPTFSPDGCYIYYITCLNTNTKEGYEYALHRMNFDGYNKTRLTFGKQIHNPVVCAPMIKDGKLIDKWGGEHERTESNSN